MLLIRTIVCILNYRTSVFFPSQHNAELRNQPAHFAVTWTPFNIKSWFGAKDPIPAGLRSRVIYKFLCAGCSACYIGETSQLVPFLGLNSLNFFGSRRHP